VSPGRAGRPAAASSVAPIVIHYRGSLRPCIGLAHRTPGTNPHCVSSSAYASVTTDPRSIADARVARLASVDPGGRPHVVPICFAIDGDTLYTAVDEKPKRTRRLRRLENIEANPHVEILIDHYDEDWSRLWWVRLRGSARIVEDQRAVELLAEKYPQYREQPPAGPVIVVTIEERSEWTSSPS
jgi:PPOX class probable F420-dependent enzyme